MKHAAYRRPTAAPRAFAHALLYPSLCLFLLFCKQGSADAQVPPRSLDDFVRTALSRNPLVRSAGEDRDAAQQTSEAIRRSYVPQFGLSSHATFAGGYDEAITNGGDLGAQLTSSYTIYDGGARDLEIRKGAFGAELGSAAWEKTRGEVIFGVSIAFARAVTMEREIAVLQDDYDNLNAYLTRVEELHASGRARETDALQTRVRLNNARIALEARSAELANDFISLAQASGLPVDSVMSADTTSFEVPTDTTFRPDVNLDIAAGGLAEHAAELDAAIAAARRNPAVSIGADAGALTSLPNLRQGASHVFGASVALSISLPLLTFGALQARYEAAEATARSVADQNLYARSGVIGEFLAAKNSYLRMIGSLRALEANRIIAEQNLALARAQYFGGAGSSLDVLDAIQMLNDVRMSMEEARAAIAGSALAMNRLNYHGTGKE